MFQIEEKLSQNPKWKEVKQNIQTLSRKGYQAVLVGGAVRDTLLGLIPEDFDIATSATPEEVLKIFPEAKKPWSQYGNTLIPFKNFEGHTDVTTFRKESSYKDGRHPNFIEYSSMEEDAFRRDFTVNALFYDVKQQKIIDFVEGLKDLKSKTLRAVGDCEKKFEEDHLRILRALRFSHQLQFAIEPKTQKALFTFSHKLSKISQERMNREWLKMFSVGKTAQGLKLLDQYKILNLVFPLPDTCKKDPYLFWKQKFSFYKDPAYFCTLIGLPYFQEEETFKNYLKKLKMSSFQMKISLSYFQSLKILLSSSSSLADQLQSLNPPIEALKELSLLWCKSYGLSDKKLHKIFETYEKMGGLPQPLVCSSDLLKDSFFSKTKLKFFLSKAFDLQIENPEKNKKEILKELKKI